MSVLSKPYFHDEAAALAEFDFCYNRRHVTDSERADLALGGAVGKRRTYRHSSAASI